MALTAPQKQFVNLMRIVAESTALDIAQVRQVIRVFEDRGYGEGGFSDEDLAEYDLTVADAAAYINGCQQLLNWFDNQAVTQGDWGAAVNKVRNLYR